MKRARAFSPRALCVKALLDVVENGRYLDAVLDEQRSRAGDDAALIQEMSYGTLRWYYQLEAIAAQLLGKPLKQKDRDVHLSILLGLYQLRSMRVAPHAVVDETVNAVDALGKSWAKGLVNACLRTYLRSPARADGIIARDPVARFSHPAWFIDSVRNDYPQQWESILQAGNERPPMTLRVNLRAQTRAQYLERLQAARVAAQALDAVDSALILESPVSVLALPGFERGDVSVQDAAAQLAATFMDLQPGMRVLDACAAPGGKTAHMLERVADLQLLALDSDEARAAQIESNLKRIALTAGVRVADASLPDTWWDGQLFDRILVDAPCSATGVIRRHPDIKLRRQPDDIAKLVGTQRQLLNGVWPLLRPGGKLLYATCSVLARENEAQVMDFLARQDDAVELPLAHPAGHARRHGLQVLPDAHTMDGFFYACLAKR
jgi:16S rRNA (cytosine967-C5)-methyltransferase